MRGKGDKGPDDSEVDRGQSPVCCGVVSIFINGEGPSREGEVEGRD